MDRNLLLFLAWCAGGLFFEGLAGYLWFCKKPVSFSAQTPEVTDVKGYNRAVAKLYMAYGGVFVLLGLPLLAAPPPGLGRLPDGSRDRRRRGGPPAGVRPGDPPPLPNEAWGLAGLTRRPKLGYKLTSSAACGIMGSIYTNGRCDESMEDGSDGDPHTAAFVSPRRIVMNRLNL